MSQEVLEAHYLPNRRLASRLSFQAYNCGYARDPADSFAAHQQSLVWQLLGDAPVSADSVVLDVGCGIGGPAGWILARHAPRRVIGVDYCASSVHSAHGLWADRPARPQFLQADAHHLPLASASVDCILSLESALHYRDKPGFLRECRRVLRPGGRLCLGDITTRRTSLLTRLANVAGSAVYLWSTDDYRAAFQQAGFELLGYEDASLPVAASLGTGLAESARLGFRERSGVRGRILFLRILRNLLARGSLGYDLFALRPR